VRASQHVFHKTLVPRHVHKPDPHVAEVEIGKTNVDGDAAPFLFGQAISVDAGQRAHEGSLAVIDVTRRAYND
jgi:hypothetical protein